jgi:hypothetical protein
MTTTQIRIGVLLRVIVDRWDARAGTLAEVTSAGHEGIFDKWCFTVRWHRPPETKRAVHRDESLNLFEADLADFEIFTGPLPPIHTPQRRRGRAIITETPSPQLGLPYTGDDFITTCLDPDPFPLVIDPHRDLDLDV